jgi:long-chain acyl-CoA synthetase
MTVTTETVGKVTSPIVIDAETIVGAFRNTVQRFPEEPALHFRGTADWQVITWADYGGRVDQVAAALEEFGIEPGDRLAIFSGNRFEWHLADLGILSHGNVTVPLYPTSSSEEVAYLLGHSESRICFVENQELLAKVLKVWSELPHLERLVVFADDDGNDDPRVTSFSEACAVGSAGLARDPGIVEERARSIRPDQLATLVYTSGTTGPPKATMISHSNIIWTLRSAISVFRIEQGERFLSFLPLSHVAERMMSDFAAIVVAGDTWFAKNIGTVAHDLLECRPTIFFGVPRIWEKMRDMIVEEIGRTHGSMDEIVRRHVAFLEHPSNRAVAAGEVGTVDKLPHEDFDSTTRTMIRQALGLDSTHLLVSSAAPIHRDLLSFLHIIGLPVIELYGQTETCGPTTSNPPEDNRIGTVGRAIPGVTVRIASDGEVLVKGGNVCAGYFRDPGSTAELIDEEGWMHSGDTGSLDVDGYLRITGRKKDLIITAAGQNIAPQDIEMGLRRHELISEAVVIGEGRRYLTALITLDPEGSVQWARRNGKGSELGVLASDPDLAAELSRFLDEENARRARVEGVRKYRILPDSFTVAGEELTPTLKVKRSVVNHKYRELIDEMYDQQG